MDIGYMAIGVGLLANGETIGMTAQRAEQAGFHSIWAPEHIVLLDQYSSKYPYSADGRIAVRPTMQFDILDPFATLTFAAAQTT